MIVKLLYYKLDGRYSISKIIEGLKSAKTIEGTEYWTVFANKCLQDIITSFDQKWDKADSG
ncbi:MAG: hypothetical protein LBI63_06485, partial [Candidatus Ancillula sp.]|nr:hypothetical protein [Candidatus Ancillula sp.]